MGQIKNIKLHIVTDIKGTVKFSMDRPKRTVRKPAKYCDEETPVKRKKASSTKENLDPEEVTVESQLVSKTVTKISKKSTNVSKKPKTSKKEIKNTASEEKENVGIEVE